MVHFRASYDRLTRVLSPILVAVFVGSALLVWAVPTPPMIRYGATLLFLLIPLITYLYSPAGYSIGPEALYIHRVRGVVRVPMESIRSARRGGSGELRGVRTFGSGGLFGYFGRFYSSRLGHYRAYLTQRGNLVVIEAEHTYVLSPDRPEEFLRHLQEWAPALRQGG